MIERINEDTLEEVMPLVRGYLDFYAVPYDSDEKHREFFRQFAHADSEACQFGFRQNGKIIAFATVYFTYVTSIAAKVGVMNDLYTAAESRGSGAGRALIDHCTSYVKSKGAARLQWCCAPDNETANRLYESLCEKKATWNFYSR